MGYSNIWWAEYIEIRRNHKSRLVKIYAETDDREGYVHKPICSLISPMYSVGILESPLHAAKFVSLIPFHDFQGPAQQRLEVWQSMQSFLARGSGGMEDHAVLLCNILLGFGLDAYLCIGTDGEGCRVWVMHVDEETQQPKFGTYGDAQTQVYFWETQTGQRLSVDDPRVHRLFRTISCVFNNK